MQEYGSYDSARPLIRPIRVGPEARSNHIPCLWLKRAPFPAFNHSSFDGSRDAGPKQGLSDAAIVGCVDSGVLIYPPVVRRRWLDMFARWLCSHVSFMLPTSASTVTPCCIPSRQPSTQLQVRTPCKKFVSFAAPSSPTASQLSVETPTLVYEYTPVSGIVLVRTPCRLGEEREANTTSNVSLSQRHFLVHSVAISKTLKNWMQVCGVRLDSDLALRLPPRRMGFENASFA